MPSCKAPGLPNIVGRFGFCASEATCGWNRTNNSNSNPFYEIGNGGDGGPTSTNSSGGAGFDASRYNRIYGAAETVQQSAISLIPQSKI